MGLVSQLFLITGRVGPIRRTKRVSAVGQGMGEADGFAATNRPRPFFVVPGSKSGIRGKTIFILQRSTYRFMSKIDSQADDASTSRSRRKYWRANLKILLLLLVIWFMASYGLSILAVDALDQFKFAGFPFGFWMAQQGSIVVFLLIILAYTIWMNRLDKAYGVEEEGPKGGQDAS